MANASQVQRALRQYASRDKARLLSRFFKTGPGEYGEGDVFIGVMVPSVRIVARQHADLPRDEIVLLLDSPIHEVRLTGLLILVRQSERGTEREKQSIARVYLRHRKRVNNWDLVDLTAPRILGNVLVGGSTAVLDKLAGSKSVWDRRIAILASFAFIRHEEFGTPLRLARRMLHDDHDLMHKAIGWMLREIGKRDEGVLHGFLMRHYRSMPRTMLRYAIERLPERRRKAYLKGKL